MTIRVERVYDLRVVQKSVYFLVDRLWPRGMRKEELKGVTWLLDVAPSMSLRKWFGHDSGKWQGFVTRYFKELDENRKSWQLLLDAAKKGSVTLLYSARDTEHNQAVALKAYMERKLRQEHAS